MVSRFRITVSSIYVRANMIASKMFVANSLPDSYSPIFDWNPLFPLHRPASGFKCFINYNPFHLDQLPGKSTFHLDYGRPCSNFTPARTHPHQLMPGEMSLSQHFFFMLFGTLSGVQ
jgi:hypothetical protein